MNSCQKLLLVVDSDSNLLQRLDGQLQGMGYEVLTATNGLQGLEELKRSSIHGILLDVLMPIMDGLTMLRRVMEKYPHIPVIVMATAANKEQLAQAITDGAMDYILKPIDRALLSQTCGRVFE
ncbi:MAG: response regulator [Nitrospiraceae bacterium]